MIFPILSGLLSWRRAPITWVIVALNLAVLLFTSFMATEAQRGVDGLLRKSYFVSTQGRLYAQYLSEQSGTEYPDFILQLSHEINAGNMNHAETLGQLAFRDYSFLQAAETLHFRGDQVAVKFWRRDLASLERYEEDHPSFTLGLSANDDRLQKWVSYIFVHSGFMHFAGNMLFLLIFGAALEMQIGGLALLVTFLLSGVFAAGVFILMTGVTSSPLVGASGAISGIMALYCALNWKNPTRFFYWFFLPLRGFMGMVFLPAWVAIVLWAINDLAGFLGTVPELGGVAHTAHLGGEVAGLLTGFLVLSWRRWRGAETFKAADAPVPMGVLIPFLPPKAPG